MTSLSAKKVKDEQRGYLIFNGVEWVFVNRYTYTNRIKKQEIEKIVLVLESPHKDEYDTNYDPIRPANGATGVAIESYIFKYAQLWNLQKNTDYEVWLVNAVQIQASCYHELNKLNLRYSQYLLNKIKYYVLNSIFDNNDLITRISSISPSIVVNCCTITPDAFITKSNKINDIYELVQSAIEKGSGKPPKYVIYKCYHPSSPFWKEIKINPQHSPKCP